MTYKLLKSGVKRLADGAFIPPTMDNMDWVRYQEWLAVGNTSEPADPEPSPKALTVREKFLAVTGLTVEELKAELAK